MLVRRHRRHRKERVPLKRVGQPADYADAILFLAVGARYMTGETILVNGGSKL